METGRLPRIAAAALARQRFEAWLLVNDDLPLRYVAAPCGAGKTTAAVLYAAAAPHPVDYVRVPLDGSVAGFWEACGRTFGRSICSLPALGQALNRGRRELIVDDLDRADVALRDLLRELPHELPPHVGAIYLARARTVIDIVPDVTAGTAVLAPPTLLPFTAQEVELLCSAQRYAAAIDAGHLVAATDGWAFAIAGTVREARTEAVSLRAGYRAWHERHQLLLAEITARSLLTLAPEDRGLAERVYAGETIEGARAVALRGAGLLIAEEADGIRPLRPIRLTARSHEPEARDVPKATIELFRDFEMTVDGRRVSWLRRRDRHIVAYLALQPDGTASRSEIMATFWPDANPQLAAQSLRTACSTIRRALAKCVGYDRVGWYFSVGRDLRLHFTNVETSVQRLDAHLRQAADALAREAFEEARGHVGAALRIYRGPLLETEGVPSWCSAAAHAYQTAIEDCTRWRVDPAFGRGRSAPAEREPALAAV